MKFCNLLALFSALWSTSSAFNIPKKLGSLSRDNISFSLASATAPSETVASNYLSSVPLGPPDAILGIAADFRECASPDKVNVCVGAYRDENGKPWVLPSVKEAESRMIDDSSQNKEYAPITGDLVFVDLALKFAYGSEIFDENSERIAGVQALSGTGACRIGGAFLSKFLGEGTKIYVPDPTWGNHIGIFNSAGLDVQKYRYFSRSTNGLDFDGMKEDLENAPSGSVVLLHACAHNPTGCDPSHDQWKELSTLIKERDLHVFFDSAYQGFASGNAEADAFALRYFVNEGHNLLLAQSFAKNFGLYGERCGTLSFICGNSDEKAAVMSQLKLLVRTMYSSPPIHGASIVKTVLSDEGLSEQYYKECALMADRIGSMRQLLVNKLAEKGSTHDWSHITSQIGMFAFTGMSKEMCDELTEKYFIFLTKDGRISLAGLNEGNVEYVAGAVHAVTDGKSLTQ